MALTLIVRNATLKYMVNIQTINNMKYFKQWCDLNVHEKINVKQFAIDSHGKRWHSPKPNFCGIQLNELRLHQILSLFESTSINNK